MATNDEPDKTEYVTVVKKDGTIVARDVGDLFQELRKLRDWNERPQLSELPELIDIPDAAEVLGVTRNTLYDWLREEECEIPVKRVGLRRKVIPKRALLDWLGVDAE